MRISSFQLDASDDRVFVFVVLIRSYMYHETDFRQGLPPGIQCEEGDHPTWAAAMQGQNKDEMCFSILLIADIPRIGFLEIAFPLANCE